ncbi:MAG TPA: thioredoxin domain-containing protein [Myxococcota bacterium]
MHPARRCFPSTAALLTLLLAIACSPGDRSPAPGQPPAADEEAGALAGRFAGREVTVGEVDDWIKEKLFANATGNRNPNRVYELRRRALEQMASEQALETAAAQAGKDVETLMREEIEKRSAVTDEEVRAYYEENQQRFGKRTFEQLAPTLRRQLEAQKRQQATQEYSSSLRAAIGFESLLEAPRFEITGTGPSRGPEDAPIRLVEFSDYQCPYCKAAEKVVDEVLERYPTQVRLEFRHFPLDSIHPHARRAAEAAMCAADQGKFWEFHRVLFEESPKLEPERLVSFAQRAGLDRAAFDTCLAEKRHAATIEADIEAGRAAGVAGTPAFYVNGRPVTAGRSLQQFSAVIDEELERLGLPVPPPPAPQAASPAPPVQPAPAAEPQAEAAPSAAPAAPSPQPAAPAEPSADSASAPPQAPADRPGSPDPAP